MQAEDTVIGRDCILKLWNKGHNLDRYMNEIWNREIVQMQRIMAYGKAHELIVDIVESIENGSVRGLVLNYIGKPLTYLLKESSSNHWLKNLHRSHNRKLFWQNMLRVAEAISILHYQGVVHGRLNNDVIMSEGSQTPDFKLSNFEFSITIKSSSQDKLNSAHVNSSSTEPFSFYNDWKCFADCIKGFLGLNRSGQLDPNFKKIRPTSLEVDLINKLMKPAFRDILVGETVNEAIKEIISTISLNTSSVSDGSYLLFVPPNHDFERAIARFSDGMAKINDKKSQRLWLESDLNNERHLVTRKRNGATNVFIMTENFRYEIEPFVENGESSWEVAFFKNIQERAKFNVFPDDVVSSLSQTVVLVDRRRDINKIKSQLGKNLLDWGSLINNVEVEEGDVNDIVQHSMLLLEIIQASIKALEVFPVNVKKYAKDGVAYVKVKVRDDYKLENVFKKIFNRSYADRLFQIFEEENFSSNISWLISKQSGLGGSKNKRLEAIFSQILYDEASYLEYLFEVDSMFDIEGHAYLKPFEGNGDDYAIKRRLKFISELSTYPSLLDLIRNPVEVIRDSKKNFIEDEYLDDLDDAKQKALRGIWSTLPCYCVVGPPGVGKTKLASEVIRRKLSEDLSSRILVVAQGHDALNHLEEKIKEELGKDKVLSSVIIVRSDNDKSTSDTGVKDVIGNLLNSLGESHSLKHIQYGFKDKVKSMGAASSSSTPSSDAVKYIRALEGLAMSAANIVITTSNSSDIERLVDEKEQFDWVIIEEAAKATTTELLGALLLSDRRLLIGDHAQLPPHNIDKVIQTIDDPQITYKLVEEYKSLVGNLVNESEGNILEIINSDQEYFNSTLQLSSKALELFKMLVLDDESKKVNPYHQSYTYTLNLQRRMDTAIAEIVSVAFYKEKLKTEKTRIKTSLIVDNRYSAEYPIGKSPIVFIDHKHISKTGSPNSLEKSQPRRWHNPNEVSSILSVLKCLKVEDLSDPPSLSILSPYQMQVDKIKAMIDKNINNDLKHLRKFKFVQGKAVNTVDSFQGNEADIVIVSLVRNNPNAGRKALGFLCDSRRMNLLLSRAKTQLIIIGSMEFLEEAVKGVNPKSDENHELVFLTKMISVIKKQANIMRNGLPLAKIVADERLGEAL